MTSPVLYLFLFPYLPFTLSPLKKAPPRWPPDLSMPCPSFAHLPQLYGLWFLSPIPLAGAPWEKEDEMLNVLRSVGASVWLEVERCCLLLGFLALSWHALKPWAELLASCP